jgi:hypothetical protein
MNWGYFFFDFLRFLALSLDGLEGSAALASRKAFLKASILASLRLCSCASFLVSKSKTFLGIKN